MNDAFVPNKIDVKEFREFGYLQELNRRFLHPLGLALAVNVPDEGEEGEETLAYIWDYRDDPEGILFGDDQLDLDKVRRVSEAEAERLPVRVAEVGFWIQEPGDKLPPK